MRTFLPLLLVLLLPALVVACGSDPSTQDADPSPTPGDSTALAQIDTAGAVPARAVEVEDFAYARNANGVRVVTGTLYNASEKRLPGAMISVALYDADNRRVGTLRVPIQDVPPGERRSFRQVVEQEEVSGARVHSVLVL